MPRNLRPVPLTPSAFSWWQFVTCSPHHEYLEAISVSISSSSSSQDAAEMAAAKAGADQPRLQVRKRERESRQSKVINLAVQERRVVASSGQQHWGLTALREGEKEKELLSRFSRSSNMNDVHGCQPSQQRRSPLSLSLYSFPVFSSSPLHLLLLPLSSLLELAVVRAECLMGNALQSKAKLALAPATAGERVGGECAPETHRSPRKVPACLCQ